MMKKITKWLLPTLAVISTPIMANNYVIRADKNAAYVASDNGSSTATPEEVWTQLPAEYSEWTQGAKSDCTEWLPLATDYLVGQTVNQSRNCNVAYTQVETISEQSSLTNEIRTLETTTIPKTEVEGESQSTIGLNNVLSAQTFGTGTHITTNGVSCSDIPANKRDWIIEGGTSFHINSSITTCNNKKLVFQPDRNVVFYNSGIAKWWSDIYSGAAYFNFQTDGHLVLYTSSSSPAWYSNTAGNHNATLVLSNGGSFYIKNTAGAIVWSK